MEKAAVAAEEKLYCKLANILFQKQKKKKKKKKKYRNCTVKLCRKQLNVKTLKIIKKVALMVSSYSKVSGGLCRGDGVVSFSQKELSNAFQQQKTSKKKSFFCYYSA